MEKKMNRNKNRETLKRVELFLFFYCLFFVGSVKMPHKHHRPTRRSTLLCFVPLGDSGASGDSKTGYKFSLQYSLSQQTPEKS